jgi:hypothetical protein
VTIVLDRGVTALGPMLVGVTFVDLMSHRSGPFVVVGARSLWQEALAAKKSSRRITLGRVLGRAGEAEAMASEVR